MCLDSEQVGQKAAAENKLAKALDDLKTRLAINEELELVWLPTVQGPLSGEIKGKQILIYEADEIKALETLQHELIEYSISTRIIRPLVRLINLLIKSKEADIYEAKEEVVEKLVGLCSQTTGGCGAAEIHRPRDETRDSKGRGKKAGKRRGTYVHFINV